MEGLPPHPVPRTVEEVFSDYRGRRAGLIKALTTGSFALFSVYIYAYGFLLFFCVFSLFCSYFDDFVEWVFVGIAEVEKFYQQCDPGKLFFLLPGLF